MYDEKNTGNNLPAEIKIARSTAMLQVPVHRQGRGQRRTRATCSRRPRRLLNEKTSAAVAVREDEDARHLGVPARTISQWSIGGTSAEFAVETAKLASTTYLD
jgi:fumarate hydratase class I